MQKVRVAIVLAVFVWACGDDDPDSRPHVHRDAGVALDASLDAAHVELEKIVAKAFDEYDRQVVANCACLAEAGAYSSAQECIGLIHSAPTWVSCATGAVAEYDSPELREHARCLLEQQKARADCLATTSCASEEHSACFEIIAECAALDPAFTLIISQECPDTTILARLQVDAGLQH
jgi:hypothetical protein